MSEQTVHFDPLGDRGCGGLRYADLGALGVDRVFLTAASKVERGYLTSHQVPGYRAA